MTTDEKIKLFLKFAQAHTPVWAQSESMYSLNEYHYCAHHLRRCSNCVLESEPCLEGRFDEDEYLKLKQAYPEHFI